MIFRTYLKKFNSIIKDSELNTGINPVAELVYGSSVSRMLIYFDTCHIKKLVDEKICPDISKFKHTLKITNAGSLDFTQIHCNDLENNRKHIDKVVCPADIIVKCADFDDLENALAKRHDFFGLHKMFQSACNGLFIWCFHHMTLL